MWTRKPGLDGGRVVLAPASGWRPSGNMLSISARVVGEGLALDIVDAVLTAPFKGGRHVMRVEMIEALEG